MRRILIILAVLALAAPAAGQPKKFTVPAAPTAPQAQPAKAPAPPILKRIAGPTQPTTNSCSLDCSRRRYFCQADGDAQDCAASWGQCRARCATEEAKARALPR